MRRKPIRVTGTDPYHLDSDRDGLGCELSDNTSNTWGLVLRKAKKEATVVKVGESLRVVGWAPGGAESKPYDLCAAKAVGVRCVRAKRTLTRGVQLLGVWKVARGEGKAASSRSRSR